jgi:hypothetical protein
MSAYVSIRQHMTDAPFTCCETICLRNEGSEVEGLSNLTVSVAASKKKNKGKA